VDGQQGSHLPLDEVVWQIHRAAMLKAAAHASYGLGMTEMSALSFICIAFINSPNQFSNSK